MARLEARLTLQEVAGEAVTRAAIHLIETGRNRPTRPTLERIAQATRKPISYFTGVQDLPPAITRDAPEESDHAAARLMVAEAWLLKGNSGAALRAAREARIAYLSVCHGAGAARALMVEGRALQARGSEGAGHVLQAALRECRALQPVPHLLEAETACELVLSLVASSRWIAARALYDEVNPSKVLVLPMSATSLYDQVAVQSGGGGPRTPAQHRAQRAIALYQMSRCQARVATVAAELGLHLLKCGDYAAAGGYLRQAATSVAGGHASS